MKIEKTVPCRNLLTKGFCSYGDRCKFSHQKQHQPILQKRTTTTLLHQPKTNTQFKPSRNRWVRNASPEAPVVKHVSSKANHQQQTTKAANQERVENHTCTDDIELCKKQVFEDMQCERPLWRLTCYSHCKYGPCDIGGDVSYEELRANAYDDVETGLSMSAVVDKEKNIQKSKSIQFENFLNCVSAASSTAQNKVTPTVSTFRELGLVTNQGVKETAPLASSNTSTQKESGNSRASVARRPQSANVPLIVFGVGNSVVASLSGQSYADRSPESISRDDSIWLKRSGI